MLLTETKGAETIAATPAERAREREIHLYRYFFPPFLLFFEFIFCFYFFLLCTPHTLHTRTPCESMLRLPLTLQVALRGSRTVIDTRAATAALPPRNYKSSSSSSGRTVFSDTVLHSAACQSRSPSVVRARRYYPTPLRAPQYGTSTIVGRQPDGGDVTSFAAARREGRWRDDDGEAEERWGAVLSQATASPPERQLLPRWLAQHPIRYNNSGIPVEGALLCLPWPEQLRLYSAVVVAFLMTAALCKSIHLELMYQRIGRDGVRRDYSVIRRWVLYYGSTIGVACAIFTSFGLSFVLLASAIGRYEMATHLVGKICGRPFSFRRFALLYRRPLIFTGRRLF